MRNIILSLLTAFFVFYTLNINAQTHEVSGNQSGTWSDTIYLAGDVIVDETSSLMIEPGTVVISKKNFSITITGNFNAEGDEENPIVFTVADTTGFADYQSINGGWGGIEFRKCNDISLAFCDFSYGKTPINGNGAGVRFYNVTDAKIHNCVFHDNIFRAKGGGVYANHSTIEVVDCEAFNNEGYGDDGSFTYGGGFFFINCDVEIENMISHDNYIPAGYGGGCSFDSCNVVLNNAVFYNNYATNGGGIGLQRSKHLDVKMANVLAFNNQVVHYGGGMAMATSSPELNNFTIVNNICGGGGGAGMQMAFESDPKINNCIIYDNHAVYSTDEGEIYEYYYGSQIWLWGDGNWPVFHNGIVQYGLDSIYHNTSYTEDHYIDMMDVNPMFFDADNQDYRLANGSPCIDSGLADLSGLFIPETDINVQPRVFNDRIDIGCYEWNNIGLNEEKSSISDLKIYPNPLNSNSFCIINLEKTTSATMRIISLDGKEIFKKDCGTLLVGENHIPLDGLTKNVEKSNKIYLLIIDTQEDRYCKKIIY